jgi:hypothetical protein
VLTITRWVFDGLRLVSLAQDACAARGLDPARHIAIVRHDRVATFLLSKKPFTREQVARLTAHADAMGFAVLYVPRIDGANGEESAPSPSLSGDDPPEMIQSRTSADDYARFILAPDRQRFIDAYPVDIRPTTDDRPFFFHTTRLADQFDVAFGRSMLFGNGLSALLTLFGISAALVALLVVGPLLIGGGLPASGWARWLAYFGALGAGFMLLEVAMLQRFVLLLGHPVYSLTVTLFSLLLGTGLGSFLTRVVDDEQIRRVTMSALIAIVLLALVSRFAIPWLVDAAIPWPLGVRIAVAAAILVPAGILLGMALPGGMRMLATRRPEIAPWGWGMNGAFSVVGATLAVFIAMNWGFSTTFMAAAIVYALAAAVFPK